MSRSLPNKNLYKIFLSILKYIPLILAIFQISGTIFNYLGYTVLFISYLGGCSILFIVLLYIMSYVFQFCYLYRIPLHYNTIIGLLKMTDLYIPFSLNILSMFQMYAGITGIFIIIFIYYMYKNRNKPKVDPIKNFCERYCECC